MAIRRIGQILVDMGFIDDDQLEMLLEEQQQQPGEKLGKIAEEMGLITDDQLVQALAEQMRLQVINLIEAKIPASTLALINDTMASLYRVIPVRFEDNELTIATSEPQNLTVADELRTFLGYTIRLVVTTDREINQCSSVTTTPVAKASRASSANSKTTKNYLSRPKPWLVTGRSI